MLELQRPPRLNPLLSGLAALTEEGVVLEGGRNTDHLMFVCRSVLSRHALQPRRPPPKLENAHSPTSAQLLRTC